MTLVQRQLSSNLVKLALVALAYWSAGSLTLQWMKLGAEASPLWLPAGIALTALLIYGEGIWLGIFLGDTFLMLTLGTGWGVILSSAIGSTLSGIIGLKLLRWSEFSPRLSRIQDVTGLIFLAGMVSSLVNATVDTLTQFIIGALSWHNFSQKWWLLWLGDCSGILVITPFLLRLIFDNRGLLRQQSRERMIEVAICGGLLLGLSWLVFVHHGKPTLVLEGGLTNAQYLEYLPFPIVVWAAIRFQTWGAVLGSLLVSILAIVGTLRGIGPFVIQTLNLTQATFLLQFFIIIINGTALLLSATVIEKQRTEKQLRVTLERDRLLAEVSLRIRESLDLKQIFQTTVAEIRQLIHADRVFIASLKDQGIIEVVAESVNGFYPSLLEGSPRDDLFTDIQSLFNDYQPFIASDLTELELPIVVEKYIKYYQVKAALVVPLHLDGKPLGLLVAHQCCGIRYWQKSEVKLLEQLATQMIIAIQQAQLYQQVQQLNSNLEKQVEERTHQLQEKIQEVQELYEMKAVFLQAVSHDLRTSIMGMLMLLNNLQNRPGDNLTLSRSILERMINSSDRQLTLINALSENHFSEERHLVIHCQPLSLKDFISQLIEDWQPLLLQNQATLSSIITDNLPPIYADSEQLDQVFEHLLTNAFKHNPPGINLTIEATVNQGMVCCRLRDNGIGMERQQCEQLFKLYLRSLHDRRRTGIGLGSYQCRQIIEAHGGTIGVNSTPGQGCEVWFTLPIAKSQPSAVS
ncbi:sensor histidine kinase [Aphanothece sacrum]|uniref:histidine kinase n=1 Tax=Aphanothece sacrum FPU1 TaxID=1920663 RepID=A0A401IDE4_APHSA|nr:MASE1 domain-containing protein [Aphanothece sacrum]GBF79308.1 two-component sensor histidine kinase [Aphanothece sacrum FPU1]GBF86811.1 two-component sensor histidine kinase [Aphanothece sacrum FPU3]